MDYTICRAGWIGSLDPSFFLENFLAGGANNLTGFASPEYDRLIQAGAVHAGPVARNECFQKAEAILMEQAPIVPIYFYTNIYVAQAERARMAQQPGGLSSAGGAVVAALTRQRWIAHSGRKRFHEGSHFRHLGPGRRAARQTPAGPWLRGGRHVARRPGFQPREPGQARRARTRADGVGGHQRFSQRAPTHRPRGAGRDLQSRRADERGAVVRAARRDAGIHRGGHAQHPRSAAVSGRQQAKFYNAASSECFGESGLHPADEETPFRPRSPYAVAKATAFWEVANYREAYGLFACSGILFNHESALRPERFVTQKIVAGACRIAAEGGQGKLNLGNLGVERDWGWAEEYVDAMWRMLQQERAEDYVIATGESRPLQDFVAQAFACVGLDWQRARRQRQGALASDGFAEGMGEPGESAAKFGLASDASRWTMWCG